MRLAVSVIGYHNNRRDGPPVVDSIHLTGEQCQPLAPPKDAKPEAKWVIPESVARRFTPALSPMTDPIFSPSQGDATKARITATAERIADGFVIIRYAGQWETDHNRDGDPKYPIRTSATGEGVGVFDLGSGKFKEMIWVLTGTYRYGPEKPRSIGSVIEWGSRP
jgi:hypothetical protein